MRISDWSSDVCSSDLGDLAIGLERAGRPVWRAHRFLSRRQISVPEFGRAPALFARAGFRTIAGQDPAPHARRQRSEEHTPELQSLMSIQTTVFGLKKKISNTTEETIATHNLQTKNK